MTTETKRLTGSEPINGLDASVIDFWSWAHSDILGNAERGVFAEYIVARCLGLTHQPRLEWDKIDLRYGGTAIEIKSSGYIQSWKQNKPSIIKFDIPKTEGWDAKTNIIEKIPKRHADIYVFCVFAEKDEGKCNVLDLSQWEFYVVSTKKLETHYCHQKSLGLNSLRKIAAPVPIEQLKTKIDETIQEI